MSNKQSSVEKMFQEMLGIQQEGIKLTFDQNLALLEKYKAMHKEEIERAHYEGSVIVISKPDDDMLQLSQQYYIEIFGE